MIKAFKLVLKADSNIKLMIVGSSWYNQIEKDEYYEELIKSHRIAKIELFLQDIYILKICRKYML